MEHDTSGAPCWCHPTVLEVCPECEGEEADAMPCWRCGGKGRVECADPATYDGPHGLIFVHNYADEGN